MKIDREEIEKRVIENLKSIQNSRQKLYELNLKLMDHNVPFGLVQTIFQNEENISDLELFILIGITSALYDLGEGSLNPNDLYGDRELRDARILLNQKQTDRVYLPITLKDVLRVNYDSYITIIRIADLVKMVESQLIVYDEETQRGVVYKESKSGGIIKSPIVNKASVKRISNKVVKNQYFEDMITLNIYSTEVEPVTYNEESRSLVINDGVVISILDGFHRLQGFTAAINNNPNIELNEILSIRVYDYETAKRFFSQINTINVLKKERRDELAQERMSDKVVADLQRKSEIGEQIASSASVNDLVGELTTFDIMSYAIDHIYEFERQLDVIKTAKYLNEFFAYLVGTFPDEFSSNIKKRKVLTMSHPLMFIGYIVLSKFMQDHEIELENIETFINKIDFEDERLLSLLLKRKSLTGNKKIRDMICEYFVNVFGGDKDE
ncbi:DNA sulfur modification protein DndB [Paenibacillus sp. FSL K6-1122]|uniref:DNA sulfur modification protein DndB n=1 Tax=Paenibacillus sp. FSL K6-1122 TaxID=2954512 RepID=UPI0030EC91BA